MSKARVFIVLTALAGGLAYVSWRTEAQFEESIWSELFWMTAGSIATTVLLESVLERDAATRRRKEDAFAFRTFTGSLVASLLDISDASPDERSAVITAALTDNARFAAAVSAVQMRIVAVSRFSEQRYLEHYLDVSNSLRDLARGYIRLFSSSYDEMVKRYNELLGIARRWEYRDTFRLERVAYWESLDPQDPVRKREQDALAGDRDRVARLLQDTAEYVADLAHHVATKPPMPPPA